MNKRIKELNLQAISVVLNGLDPDGDIKRMYIPAEFTKKFAELIVQDCVEFAGCNGHVSGFTLGDLIKQHFGVES